MFQVLRFSLGACFGGYWLCSSRGRLPSFRFGAHDLGLLAALVKQVTALDDCECDDGERNDGSDDNDSECS